MICDNPTLSVAESIQNDGYHLDRGFLSQDEVTAIRSLYDNTQRAANKNYPIKQIIDCSVFPASVLAKIEKLQKACFPNEEMMLHGAVFFAVNKNDAKNSVNFPFHQDHESFFLFQEHYYYLNFYIVIDKEDVENSNLTVVPFGALKNQNPVMHDILAGAGATHFRDGSFYSDATGTKYKYDFSLDEISITPHLGVGDLLTMRGDMIHKTQNQAADRIAVSFRAVRKTSVCNRRSVLFPSRVKLSMINKNFLMYASIDYLFAKNKQDYLTVEDMFTQLIAQQKLTEKKKPLDVVWHVAMYKLRVMLLRATCWMW